jgi:phenylacetate-CoA ligase
MSSRFEKRLRKIARPPVLQRYFVDEGEFPENMPPNKLQEFQRKSLHDIIERAYHGSSFYRDKLTEAGVTPEDFQNLDDLKRFPFTSKDELRGKPWDLLTCDKEDIALVQVSTGTTGGEEIYIMYTWNDFYLHDLAPGYPSLVPVEPGDICFNALPYEMSSAGLAFHKTFIEGCGATVVPAGKGGAYSTPVKSVKMLRDLQPNIVITTPSWAAYLAETAQEMKFNLPNLHLKKMWLTGEGCSPAFRERMEKIWGTVANFYYGSLECGCIGIECDSHNGYHITQGHVVMEIVDPKTGKVLEPGEIGEIVISCLLRYDTPILRYRTQDLGYIDTDSCQCGVLMPRIVLRGRLVDQIIIQGIAFSPYYLEEFLMRFPEVGNWFQFVVDQEKSNQLLIKCELAREVGPSPELAENLAGKMEYATGVPCRFEFVDYLPRPTGKTIKVITN